MKDLLGRMTISEWVSSLIALTVGAVVPPVLSRGHAPLQVLALAGAGMALGVFVLTRKRGFWFLLIPAWQIAAALVLYSTPETREFFRGSNGLPFAVGFSPWCSAEPVKFSV